MSDTILDLDSMLDGNLDSVQAAPDYTNLPPVGSYKFDVTDAKLEKFKKKGKDGEADTEAVRIRLSYALTTIELAKDAGEPPLADGTLYSESFMYSEEGLPWFKKHAQAVLNTDIAGASMRDLLDGLKGASFEGYVSHRVSTVNGKEYKNVSLRVIPPTA